MLHTQNVNDKGALSVSKEEAYWGGEKKRDGSDLAIWNGHKEQCNTLTLHFK